VSIHADLPYLDRTGLSLTYRPPTLRRAPSHAALRNLHGFI
jgi:hypothetical protein